MTMTVFFNKCILQQLRKDINKNTDISKFVNCSKYLYIGAKVYCPTLVITTKPNQTETSKCNTMIQMGHHHHHHHHHIHIGEWLTL